MGDEMSRALAADRTKIVALGGDPGPSEADLTPTPPAPADTGAAGAEQRAMIWLAETAAVGLDGSPGEPRARAALDYCARLEAARHQAERETTRFQEAALRGCQELGKHIGQQAAYDLVFRPAGTQSLATLRGEG